MSTTSPILGIPFIESQQSQPEVTHNEAISLIQIMLAGGAITIGDNTPPVSPAEGDVYVAGTAPTGAWDGRANTIAGFFLNQWLFVPGNDSSGTPIEMSSDQEGLTIWSKTDNALFTWTDLGASPEAFTWRPSPSNITQLALLDDTNISAPSEDDIIQFVSGLWTNRASNTVFFSSEDVLPAAVAGVVTLVGKKIYQLTGDFSMSNRLVLGDGTHLTGGNAFSHTLTYTGAGTFITGIDVDTNVSEIKLDSPNGQVFDISETVGGAKITLLTTVNVVSCAKFGTFDDGLSLVIQGCACLNADDGVTVSGTSWTIHSFTKFALISAQPDFTGIDLGSSLTTDFEADNLVFVSPAASPSTAVGIKGLANGGNLVAGAIGTITNSTFAGGITPLEGVDEDDVRWSLKGNSANVEDTMPDALISLSGNAVTTTVSGGNPALIAGVWVEQRASHFITDANGRITYIGERPLVVPINIIATIEPASGTNKDLELYIALNGTEITETKMIRRTDSGNPGVISTMWQIKMEQNDFIEGFTANASDDVAVLVSDAILRLR